MIEPNYFDRNYKRIRKLKAITPTSVKQHFREITKIYSNTIQSF